MCSRPLFWLALCPAVLILAAGPTSIYGTWTRDFGKTTTTPPQEMVIYVTADEFSQITSIAPQGMTIRLNGKSVDGGPSMRRIDRRTLEQTFYRQGQPFRTSRYMLSRDGKILTILAEGKYLNGKPYSNTVVFRRIGGAPSEGFNGKWRDDQALAKERYPFTITFTQVGSALRYEDGGGGTLYTAEIDGKQHPTSGNIRNQTVVLQRLADGSIRATFRTDGKVSRTVIYAVSASGHTLTETSDSNVGGTPVRTVNVYERQ